ncbi:undecaprenyl-phosphate glucose phosphotransferase [Lysobacter sp. H21R4]|nr:undecaprenyl-phosphate glucose phosphotransferase [Lysobacter sp. H21R4]
MLRASDLGVLVLTGMIAYWLRFETLDIPLDYQRNIAAGTLFAVLVFNTSSLYQSWRGSTLSAEYFRAAGLWTVAFAAGLLFAVGLKLAGDVSRVWWGAWYAGALVGLGGVRLLCRSSAALVRQQGLDLRTAVVVGATAEASRIVETLKRERWAGIRVQGWFSTPVDNGRIDSIPRLGDMTTLAAYVEERRINQVWIALPLSAQSQIDTALAALRHSTADIKLVPDLFGLRLLNHSIGQIAGLPVIHLRDSPLDGYGHLVKAIEDKVLASLILVLIAPLLVLIAIGVKLSSPGPVLFRQKRHGRDGKVIKVWKFRSMRVHQEAEGKVTQARKQDTRITPFGAFLRRTSLDELPQFWNVLQGTMSIVGPRPHAIAHNHEYKEVVQDYMQRHRIKPGITGWAQVNGLRGETDTVEKMAARVEYDLYYVQNWSLWFDLRIILITAIKGFFDKHAY